MLRAEIKRFFNTPISFLVVSVALAALVYSATFLVPKYGADESWYVAVAQGHINEVIKPFSGRFLQPMLAGQISSRFGLGINQSFLILTVVSMVLFLVINSVLLKKTLRTSLLLVPLFLLPYFATISQAFILPDFFYVFLILLFFISLLYKKEGIGLAVLFLLFLTRESTILLGSIFLLVCLLRSRKMFSIAVLLVLVVSVFASQKINNLGLPNAHNLDSFSYLALKAPYNFLNNVMGSKLWVNTLPDVCAPVATFDLPRRLSAGSINKIGFCGFDATMPLQTLVSLLTVFGVLPMILFYILSLKFKLIFKHGPFWLVVALIYGLLAYFSSVFVTNAIQRSAGFGWPAFLFVTPLLLRIFFEIDNRFLIRLSILQLFVAWLPIAIMGGSAGSFWPLLLTALVAFGAYIYVFNILKNQKKVLFQIEQYDLSVLSK